MAKEELALLKEIDHAQEMESKWFEEGKKLRAEYKRKYKKEA